LSAIYDEWHPRLERFFQSNYVFIADRAGMVLHPAQIV
jgi:hypothetical protein